MDSLVNPPEGRNINSLSPDGTSGTDTGRVFTRTAVDDGIDGDLDGVKVGEEVDDLERVLDDADGHELLAVVAAVHHEGVGETLDDGALSLAETLGGVTTGGVGDVDGGTDLDVVAVGIWKNSLLAWAQFELKHRPPFLERD